MFHFLRRNGQDGDRTLDVDAHAGRARFAAAHHRARARRRRRTRLCACRRDPHADRQGLHARHHRWHLDRRRRRRLLRGGQARRRRAMGAAASRAAACSATSISVSAARVCSAVDALPTSSPRRSATSRLKNCRSASPRSRPRSVPATRFGSRAGALADAVRASYALPGIFPAVEIGRRWLMDGALVNPVPVSAARALGARVVIAVNVNTDLFGRGTTIHDHGAAAEEEARRSRRKSRAAACSDGSERRRRRSAASSAHRHGPVSRPSWSRRSTSCRTASRARGSPAIRPTC